MSLAILGPHIAIGVLLVVAYWRTLLSPKGSTSHRRAGKLCLLLLVPLLTSTVPLIIHESARGAARVVQLLYLTLVVVTGAWTAWRAIRDRHCCERFTGPVFCALGAAMFISGMTLLTLGIVTENVLTVGFSMIGVVYGGAMLGFLGRSPMHGWWLDWHLNGICLMFAAFHASFVGLAFRVAWPTSEGPTMHTLTQLGTLTIAYALRQWLGRRYDQYLRTPSEPRLSAVEAV